MTAVATPVATAVSSLVAGSSLGLPPTQVAGVITRQLLGLPAWDSNGKLVPGSWTEEAGSLSVTDNYGLTFALLDGMLPYVGARYPQNILNTSNAKVSEYFDDWDELDTGACNNNLFTGSSYGDRIVQYNLPVTSGDDLTVSLTVDSLAFTGGGKLSLYIYDGSALTKAFEMSEDISTRKRYGGTITITNTSAAGQIQLRQTGSGTVSAQLVNIQIEDVTGKSNQNPSEYQAVGTGTGSELNTNVGFDEWAVSTQPDDWPITGNDASNHFTEHVNGVRLVSDGTGVYISYSGLAAGVEYHYRLEVSDWAAGGVKLLNNWTELENVSGSNQTVEGVFTASSGTVRLMRVGTDDLVIAECSFQATTMGLGTYNTENKITMDGAGLVSEGSFTSGVIYGDSFTDGPTDLGSNLPSLAGVSFATMGQGGIDINTIKNIMVADAPQAGTDFVLLQGGINTLAGASSDPNNSMQMDMQEEVDHAIANNLSYRIFPIGPWKNYVALWTSTRQGYTDTWHTWLIDTYGSHVIDLYTILEDPANPDELLPAYDSGDGIHPNAAGYAAVDAVTAVSMGILLSPAPVLTHETGVEITHSLATYVDATQSTIMLRIKPSFAKGGVVNNALISLDTTNGPMYLDGSGNIAASDGTNTVTLSSFSWSPNDEIVIVTTYGESGLVIAAQNITTVSAWSRSSGSFTGIMATGNTNIEYFLSVADTVGIIGHEILADEKLDADVESDYGV